MKKAIVLLVFVLVTFTTSLIYAEDYNLSQQQKDKIDKVVLKVESIINKQSTKEKKEKLKEKILVQLNDMTLKIMWRWDPEMLYIVFYLTDKIQAIWGASRYPWCSADDINIWGLLFSACNLWASTPNELWLKWRLASDRSGKFYTGESSSTINYEKFVTCAEWYTPLDDSMPGFISYLEKQNKNFLEELKVPNIDTWKIWLWNSQKPYYEFLEIYRDLEPINKFTLWAKGEDSASVLFYEWVRTAWPDINFWYTRCVKWDFMSLRTQIDELINK